MNDLSCEGSNPLVPNSPLRIDQQHETCLYVVISILLILSQTLTFAYIGRFQESMYVNMRYMECQDLF